MSQQTIHCYWVKISTGNDFSHTLVYYQRLGTLLDAHFIQLGRQTGAFSWCAATTLGNVTRTLSIPF